MDQVELLMSKEPFKKVGTFFAWMLLANAIAWGVDWLMPDEAISDLPATEKAEKTTEERLEELAQAAEERAAQRRWQERQQRDREAQRQQEQRELAARQEREREDQEERQRAAQRELAERRAQAQEVFSVAQPKICEIPATAGTRYRVRLEANDRLDLPEHFRDPETGLTARLVQNNPHLDRIAIFIDTDRNGEIDRLIDQITADVPRPDTLHLTRFRVRRSDVYEFMWLPEGQTQSSSTATIATPHAKRWRRNNPRETLVTNRGNIQSGVILEEYVRSGNVLHVMLMTDHRGQWGTHVTGTMQVDQRYWVADLDENGQESPGDVRFSGGARNEGRDRLLEEHGDDVWLLFGRRVRRAGTSQYLVLPEEESKWLQQEYMRFPQMKLEDYGYPTERR